MVEAGTLCINADVIRKAGAGVSTTGISEAYTNVFIVDAEAYINLLCGYDFVNNFGTLDTNTLSALREATSCLAGIYAAQFDSTGYGGLRIWENVININWARFVQITSLLRDQKKVKIIEKQKLLGEASSKDIVDTKIEYTRNMNSMLDAVYKNRIAIAELNKSCGMEVF